MTPLQKLPKNVGDLGKLIVAEGFEKSNKLPNLVTLTEWQNFAKSGHTEVGPYDLARWLGRMSPEQLSGK